MDDSEAIAAIAAGDPAGLAAAYDAYAAPLYGYCRWMLREPASAADALRDTFVRAAAQPGGPRDATSLRAWLYAAARQECYRRVRTIGAGFDEIAEESGPPDESGRPGDARHRAERAEVGRLIRDSLAELKPLEHEVIELSVRHSLDEADLAAVLDISWSRAHVLASRAREHLEMTLGAMLIARTGRQYCPELSALLADWDGRLTVQTGLLTADHIERCETCAGRKYGTLRLEALSGLLPLAALPPGLRAPVLQSAAASAGPSRRPLIQRAGAPWLAGFRRAEAFLGRSRIRANPGSVTAVVAVVVWIVAAVSATLITVTGMHSVRALAAPAHSGAALASTPSASSQAPPSVRPRSSRSREPTTQPVPALVHTVELTPSASPAESAAPSPSKPATSSSPSSSSSPSTSASPSPSHTPTPTPTPTSTPSATST